MAIERKNFGGNAAHSKPAATQPSATSGQELVSMLEWLRSLDGQILSYEQALDVCTKTVHELVEISVPCGAGDIKDFRDNLQEIGAILSRMLRSSDKAEKIYIACLQKLYTQLVLNKKPSAAAAIVFDIYDETSLPKAIRLLIKSTTNADNDNDLKWVITTLCTWNRTFSGTANTSHCIIFLLDGLRELQKYKLLMEIAADVIEQQFLSSIIPVVRHSSIRVFKHILCSAQSKSLFDKIVPRITRVLMVIETNYKKTPNDLILKEDFQDMIDLLWVFVNKFNQYDGTYEDIVNALKDYRPSGYAESLLDVETWHPPIKKRDPLMPIGLVNLGNTCYMNSVLQALFMTKDLTFNILLMKLPSRIINLIQQLISLLLYSVRLEITPNDVLGERPKSFRPGYQQDSFEYLGFLLDQLHEEEKRCRTKANNNNNNHVLPVANGIKTEKLENGTINHTQEEQMEIDENPEFEPPVSTESTPLTAESDDSVNSDGIKSLNSSSTNGNCTSTDTRPTTISPTTPTNNNTKELATANTMIQQLFGGQLLIKIKCLNCSSVSTNVDNFFDLQLSFPQPSGDGVMMMPSPLADKTTYTTQSLVNSYFSTEKMIDDDKYFCDKCKMLCDGERNITLKQGPANLILLIKHFKYDRNYHVRRKLLHKVHHDEVFTLIATTENRKRMRLTYKLYAVVVHCGMNIDSGHYYTYAVNESNVWYKFNDSHISRSSFSEIKNLNNLNTPYILFYELMGSEVVTDVDNEMEASEASTIATAPADSPTAVLRRKRKCENPSWDDLPPRLQEFVLRDNLIYTDQVRQKSYSNEMMKNLYNKHRKSDNDQDPPSSCGGNIVEQTNGYIY